MPGKRRRRIDPEELIDDVVDSALDGLMDRAGSFVDQLRHRQQQAATQSGNVRDVYICAPCRKRFALEQMEMINPNNEFGICENCWRFMWQAAEEKLRYFAKKQAQQQRARGQSAGNGGQQGQQQAQQPRKKPWEVLGISPDASIDEVKRAYRKKAAEYHPDTVPPGASAQEREHARFMFEEVTRARDAMMKVRTAPGA